MNDDEWMAEQDRRRNLDSFSRPARVRRTRHRYEFTPEQMAIAMRVLEREPAPIDPQSYED